jgi:hypothetical protein
MANIEFELNSEGVKELMRSPEMQAALIANAKAIQSRAGDGYSVYVGPSRANVSVRTETDEAIQDNYDNNRLLKAVRR